ncbi:hypothetical protein [Streptomyces sp. SID3343]|nr:hypothetical protein [Streptomyces sp. SID3343]MYV99391.1 hypothetical protein [Streptomyces sp. SID3343]
MGRIVADAGGIAHWGAATDFRRSFLHIDVAAVAGRRFGVETVFRRA